MRFDYRRDAAGKEPAGSKLHPFAGDWCIDQNEVEGADFTGGLDYALIRANAKVFVGLSDVTALHLAILRRARMVTFHGPAGISSFSDYSMAYLRAAFMEPRASYTIAGAPENRVRDSAP